MLSTSRLRPSLVFLVLAPAALVLGGCTVTNPSPPDADSPRAAEADRRFTILGVNDVYRIGGVDGQTYGGIARLRRLRSELEDSGADVLAFLAGDFLYPSLLSRVYEGAQMVDVLNLLDGDPEGFDDRFFVTFGNHEFDREDLEDAPMLQARVDESQFGWIASNLVWASDTEGRSLIRGDHLVDTKILEIGGVRVGIFGLTIDSEHPEYVEAFLPPRKVAEERTALLRDRGAEMVIGLTHLDMSTDLAILQTLGARGPDLIFGGHEHNKLFERVDGRWVVKADAEARTAAVIEVAVPTGGRPRIEVEFRELGPGVEEDHRVRERVDEWTLRHDEEFCRDELGLEPGCLDDRLGVTRVRLEAEELEIRMHETNLGSWLLDLALEAFRPYGAQIAFTNSGSLRLNQDVAPGGFTRRHLEELFQYPSGLELMRVTGAELQQAIEHATDGWGYGNGYFLQIAGFAYRHDPRTSSAGDLTLLGPDGPRRIFPDEEILAVTGDFLATAATGQDGFTMLREDAIVPIDVEIDLRGLAIAALERAGDVGIAPDVDGRICNELLQKVACRALRGDVSSQPVDRGP